MIRFALMFALTAGLAACGNLRRDQIAFDGQTFRSKAAKASDDRRAFTVEVRPVSASMEGAREAGRFEATKYCVETFGNSAVVWQVGPEDDPASYALQGDTLVLQGTCEG